MICNWCGDEIKAGLWESHICIEDEKEGEESTVNPCPICNQEMHTNTVLVLGGKNKHYQECPSCGYKGKAK